PPRRLRAQMAEGGPSPPRPNRRPRHPAGRAAPGGDGGERHRRPSLVAIPRPCAEALARRQAPPPAPLRPRSPMPITLICLDADDTLWHNELYFRRTFGSFAALLADFAPADEVQRALDETEHRNLAPYGYGDKRPETYARIFARYGAEPAQAVMAGNSIRSDILPALEAGAWAAFIPFELEWAHEAAEPPVGHARYRELASLGDLPEWLDAL